MAAKARKASKRTVRSPRKGKKTKIRLFDGVGVFPLAAGVAMALLALAVFFMYVCRPFLMRFTGPEREPEYFKDYNIRGIDISHYQKEIAWHALEQARLNGFPIRFVIIKASEGRDMRDRCFRDNFKNARRHGFVRGAYHFFNPHSDPIRQAEHYFRHVHLLPGDLPPILDVESRGSKPLAEFRNDVLRWLDYAHKKTGVLPILYTGARFRYDYLRDPRFDKYPFWVAHYNMRRLRYQGEWVMWQYSDKGRISGIEGDVDLNLFNGKFSDLQRLLIPTADTIPAAADTIPAARGARFPLVPASRLRPR